tara:strand:- start:343 stop:1062 length:720 start_codon:yes stop_codon:yes gene_type:complete
MMKKNINQKMISQIEFYRMNNLNIVIKNSPISRFIEKSNSFTENPKEKEERLNQLKEKIKKVDEDVLKRNAKNIVFSDGNINSKIMLIGEGPGQKEDEMGKPFVGDAGILLNKMLKSINIDRDKVYITNVVNYRPPNNRKPDPVEINKYAKFLKEHISILNPKILILMGSTAMEALFGSKIKISKERGVWKKIVINNKTYLVMITFHPAYLLRQADQKKYSWADLKEIRKKIDQLKIIL